MRLRPASCAALAGASLLAPWLLGRSSRADVVIVPPILPTSSIIATSTYLPTSTILPTTTYLPTSSIVSTSAYLPTSSIVSTSAYLPTSTIVESSYLPTSSYVTTVRRGGLFRPRRFVERTTYLGSSSYLEPTAYYTPTSYFSSSLLPTTYVPTTYVSSLLPTSYVVPTVATATLVPTTYLPTSIISPTSYVLDSGVIATSATSSICCDTAPSSSVPIPSAPTQTRAVGPRTTVPSTGPAITSQPTNGSTSAVPERRPSAIINPAPAEPPPAVEAQPDVARTAVPPAPKTPADTATPPAPGTLDPGPAPEKPGDLPDFGKPGTLGTQPGPPSTDEAINRTSMRPSTYPSRPGTRNILRGRVVSWETGRGEEFVTVVLQNRSRVYEDRTAMTDADGQFKVSLPDGDWAVKVKMDSGSVYTVGRGVTATAGRVLDASSSEVRELLIQR